MKGENYAIIFVFEAIEIIERMQTIETIQYKKILVELLFFVRELHRIHTFIKNKKCEECNK